MQFSNPRRRKSFCLTFQDILGRPLEILGRSDGVEISEPVTKRV